MDVELDWEIQEQTFRALSSRGWVRGRGIAEPLHVVNTGRNSLQTRLDAPPVLKAKQ